jgi:HK97 family phage major capsid protein
VSWTLLQDSAFDVQGLVSRLLSTRIARIQATHLATGNGSAQPLGLLSGLTGANPAASTGITYNDLIGFIHQVDPAYRAGGNCRWVFNDTSLSTIEQMQDSNGDPLWRTMLATMGDGASYGRLLGYPITIDQGCPNIDPDNSAQNWGAFGDIRAGYVIRRVRGIVIVVNPYSRTNYRQTEFSAWARMDATQQDTHAYTALAGLDAS